MATHTATEVNERIQHTDLVGVVEDITAKLSVQEFIEVGHETLSFHCSLSRGVHPFQLVAKVTHLGGHIADVHVKLLEMLKGYLK